MSIEPPDRASLTFVPDELLPVPSEAVRRPDLISTASFVAGALGQLARSVRASEARVEPHQLEELAVALADCVPGLDHPLVLEMRERVKAAQQAEAGL